MKNKGTPIMIAIKEIDELIEFINASVPEWNSGTKMCVTETMATFRDKILKTLLKVERTKIEEFAENFKKKCFRQVTHEFDQVFNIISTPKTINNIGKHENCKLERDPQLCSIMIHTSLKSCEDCGQFNKNDKPNVK